MDICPYDLSIFVILLNLDRGSQVASHILYSAGTKGSLKGKLHFATSRLFGTKRGEYIQNKCKNSRINTRLLCLCANPLENPFEMGFLKLRLHRYTIGRYLVIGRVSLHLPSGGSPDNLPILRYHRTLAYVIAFVNPAGPGVCFLFVERFPYLQLYTIVHVGSKSPTPNKRGGKG